MDIFCRRTEMSLFIKHTKAKEAAQKVAELMAQEYGWDDSKMSAEIQAYLEHIKKTVTFL